MSILLQDLRFGARALARQYRSTLVAVLSLGLGIGAVASIYSTVSAVLLNPVPFPEPHRIAHLFDTVENRPGYGTSSSYADFLDYQDSLGDVFEHLGAFTQMDVNITGPSGPERVYAGAVSSGFLPMLRVQPVLGRGFLPEEDRHGADMPTIISYRLWERLYNKSQGVIGQGLTVDGLSYTIVGVLPEDFRFVMIGDAQVILPILRAAPRSEDRGSRWLACWGRLKPGVSNEQAEAAYQNVVARLSAQYPGTNAGRSGRLAHPGELMLDDFRGSLQMLMGAVGFVLLIACVNVANLLLANAAGRRKEIAVRAALGASRGRIIRQLLTESVLLAVLGGLLGLLLALWGNELINSLLPAVDRDFHIQYFQFGIKPHVLLFTLGITLATGLLFGLTPALEASKFDLHDALKEGGRGGGAGRRRHRLLAALVVSEVALALVLLIGAGLMIQSLRRIQNTDPGFSPENLLVFNVSLPRNTYEEPHKVIQFYQDFVARARQIPGVAAVGASQSVPFTGSNSNTSVSIEGKPEPAPGQRPLAGFRVVTAGYLESLGARLIAGRHIAETDQMPERYWADHAAEKGAFTPDTPERVALVNQTMAEAFWPGEDALGKRFSLGALQPDRSPSYFRVIGIVSSFRHSRLSEAPQPELYLAHAQVGGREMDFVLRGTVPVETLVGTLREVMRELDPNQPIANVKTMKLHIEEIAWFNNFIATVLACFALIALVLSAIGVYGVSNVAVVQRTHEIGVRMALGATPGHVQRMILRQGLKLTLVGGAIGAALALIMTRLMQDLLFEVSPYDPATFALVAATLLFTAGAATWLPARKATKVDPVIALRYE